MDIAKRIGQMRGWGRTLLQDPSQARHLPRLYKTLGVAPLDVDTPWLAFDVIDWLDDTLTTTSRVFEYGGGGSTAFFAKKAGRVVTVEHEAEWAHSLTQRFAGEDHVDIIVPDADPAFEPYIHAVGQFPADWFDLVLIDGRERVNCVRAAMPHVRSGGYIMLDDSERDRYSPAFEMMNTWPRRSFQGLSPWKATTGHTTVWRKP